MEGTLKTEKNQISGISYHFFYFSIKIAHKMDRDNVINKFEDILAVNT